jgi:hypothetical protein
VPWSALHVNATPRDTASTADTTAAIFGKEVPKLQTE